MSDKRLRTKCPCCGEYMYDKNGDIVCQACGYEDYDYYIRQANKYYPEPEEIPVGCEACGGPYPDCKDSCRLFDD